MQLLWKLYFDICRFRSGPQDVPPSMVLMQGAMVVYFLLGVVLSLLSFDLAVALGRTLMDLVVMVVVLALLLWWRGNLARFVQTLSAMAGTGIVISLFAAPILVMLNSLGPDSPVVMIPAIIWVGIFCWSIAVTGHIFRHALNVSLIMGVMFAVGYVMVTLDLLSRFFEPVT